MPDSLSTDLFEAIKLIAPHIEDRSRRAVLLQISVGRDVGLRQTCTVQRFGGEARTRGAIVTADIECWPADAGSESYPRPYAPLPRIERIEALTCAMLAAWDWIANARNNGGSKSDGSIGTVEALRIAHAIGIADDPNIQRTSERMRAAGYYRESYSHNDPSCDTVVWNDARCYPLDTFEDRKMCAVCHYPIGSWEPERFARVEVHENCILYLKNRTIIIKEPDHATDTQPQVPQDSSSDESVNSRES